MGQQTQARVQNLISTRVKQVLAQAQQLETISSFSFELPFETQIILKQKEVIEELIKQPSLTFIPKEIQTIMLALPFTSFLKNKDRDFVKTYYTTLIQIFASDTLLFKITKSVFALKTDTELIKILEKAVGRIEQLLAKNTVTFVKKGGNGK